MSTCNFAFSDISLLELAADSAARDLVSLYTALFLHSGILVLHLAESPELLGSALLKVLSLTKISCEIGASGDSGSAGSMKAGLSNPKNSWLSIQS